jgi:hypothetical protein
MDNQVFLTVSSLRNGFGSEANGASANSFLNVQTPTHVILPPLRPGFRRLRAKDRTKRYNVREVSGGVQVRKICLPRVLKAPKAPELGKIPKKRGKQA